MVQSGILPYEELFTILPFVSTNQWGRFLAVTGMVSQHGRWGRRDEWGWGWVSQHGNGERWGGDRGGGRGGEGWVFWEKKFQVSIDVMSVGHEFKTIRARQSLKWRLAKWYKKPVLKKKIGPLIILYTWVPSAFSHGRGHKWLWLHYCITRPLQRN